MGLGQNTTHTPTHPPPPPPNNLLLIIQLTAILGQRVFCSVYPTNKRAQRNSDTIKTTLAVLWLGVVSHMKARSLVSHDWRASRTVCSVVSLGSILYSGTEPRLWYWYSQVGIQSTVACCLGLRWCTTSLIHMSNVQSYIFLCRGQQRWALLIITVSVFTVSSSFICIVN